MNITKSMETGKYKRWVEQLMKVHPNFQPGGQGGIPAVLLKTKKGIRPITDRELQVIYEASKVQYNDMFKKVMAKYKIYSTK